MRQAPMKVLVIYDVHVQEVSQIPLIINYGESLHCKRLIHANLICRFTESRRRVYAPVSISTGLYSFADVRLVLLRLWHLITTLAVGS